jgi:hypothetical protein
MDQIEGQACLPGSNCKLNTATITAASESSTNTYVVIYSKRRDSVAENVFILKLCLALSSLYSMV